MYYSKASRIIVCIIAMAVMLFSGTAYVWAEEESESTAINSNEVGCVVPIFDSVEEAEAALANVPEPPSPFSAGGTQYCIIKPYIVRNHGTTCALYLDFNSNFRLNAVRFKELIVEDFYLLGKNYLKLTSAGSSSSYVTFNFGSVYSGKRIIYDEFEIPRNKSEVYVRTKGLGVYHNENSQWLSATWQITGSWVIDY